MRVTGKGITDQWWIFQVALTDFAMDFSAQRDGFRDGFCGGFFFCLLCFPMARDGFCDGFWDLVSMAKDGKRAKNIWG